MEGIGEMRHEEQEKQVKEKQLDKIRDDKELEEKCRKEENRYRLKLLEKRQGERRDKRKRKKREKKLKVSERQRRGSHTKAILLPLSGAKTINHPEVMILEWGRGNIVEESSLEGKST